MSTLIVATLPLHPALGARECASIATRIARASLPGGLPGGWNAMNYPLPTGAQDLLDLVIEQTLGSFIEVECRNATGELDVVPFGIGGTAGTLGVIDLGRVSRVQSPGARGTTVGAGELIQDVLDEGAYSILLAHSEPLACDLGLGMAQALGVRFLDAHGEPLDLSRPDADLFRVQRVDVSGRLPAVLTSRFYLALQQHAPAPEEQAVDGQDRLLAHLLDVLERSGLTVPAIARSGARALSPSLFEVGASAFLNAIVGDPSDLAAEAIELRRIVRGETTGGDSSGSAVLLIAESTDQIERSRAAQNLLTLAREMKVPVHIVTRVSAGDRGSGTGDRGSGAAIHALDHAIHALDHAIHALDHAIHALDHAKVFLAPLREDASAAEVRRDISLRLEKVLPSIVQTL